MTKNRTTCLALIVLLATLAVSAGAEAQRRGFQFRQGRAIDGVRIDVHMTANWYEALGVGARVEFALVPDGFIERVHDELALSLGGEFFFWAWHHRHGNGGYWDFHHHGVAFMPLAAAQWNFYLNESWSLFPEAGFAMAFFTYEYEDRGNVYSETVFRAYPLISFGARWHFSDRNALFVRATWPVGGQFGITF